MVLLLLRIVVAATVVPLETKALPVKSTCPPETVDSSKNKKPVSQLFLLISIFTHALVHIICLYSVLLYIFQSVRVCSLCHSLISAIYFEQLHVLDCSTDVLFDPQLVFLGIGFGRRLTWT